MARPLRIEYEGAFYHITARGNERRKIFLSEDDYQKYLAKLSDAIPKFSIVLHAYVLMGNHYHLIVETPQANLSAFMQALNSSYTTYFNIKRKRAGHLFQGRYKAILIDADSYLLELSRYIHLNPVRAGIVNDPTAYPWSSYRAYTAATADTFVTREKLWGMISGNRKQAPQLYADFVKAAIVEPQQNLFEGIYGGMILGTKAFVMNTLQKISIDTLQRREVSNRRALTSALSVEEIIQHLSGYFKEPQERIISSSPYRAYAVYLSRKHTPITNAEIGRYFGISYSAVTKIGTRLKKSMEKDRKLESKISKIEGEMSRVKG